MTQADLFAPAALGPYTLSNRIAMAPLTRSRADGNGLVGPLVVEYYSQRASAGLLISEGVVISPQGRGYYLTPGLYSEDQVAAWRKVTDAVHAKGGHIFAQLWHVGRVSHVSLQPGGADPVAPSAVTTDKVEAFTAAGRVPLSPPRALGVSELPGIVADYRRAARNAIAAGFDGVEVHGANGYLLDQFLRDGANKRTDSYGGSIENRARLLLEVMAAVTEEIGGNRTGLRLSPISPANGLTDSDPRPLFHYVVEQLNRFGLAYLHIVEGATGGPREVEGGFDLGELRRLFKGPYMANNGYTLEMAKAALADGGADFIAFGRPFVANPDLVERLRTGAPLAQLNVSTLYGGGAAGYTDYPTLTGK